MLKSTLENDVRYLGRDSDYDRLTSIFRFYRDDHGTDLIGTLTLNGTTSPTIILEVDRQRITDPSILAAALEHISVYIGRRFAKVVRAFVSLGIDQVFTSDMVDFAGLSASEFATFYYTELPESLRLEAQRAFIQAILACYHDISAEDLEGNSLLSLFTVVG